VPKSLVSVITGKERRRASLAGRGHGPATVNDQRFV
jgi:hypothetical protein